MTTTNKTTVIRMGAAHWDAQVEGMHFDLRTMSRDQQKDFHRAFSTAFRAIHERSSNPSKPKGKRKHR